MNQRMSDVALLRAREEAVVHTNAEAELGEAVDGQVNKELALEAVDAAKPASQHAAHPPQAFVQEHSHGVAEQGPCQAVTDRCLGMSW